MYPPAFVVLALLPTGAVAAWLSRRAGGSVRDRLMASQFPAVLFGMILMLFAVADGTRRDGIAVAVLESAPTLFGWTAIAGFALLIGAAPFLRPMPPSGSPPGFR